MTREPKGTMTEFQLVLDVPSGEQVLGYEEFFHIARATARGASAEHGIDVLIKVRVTGCWQTLTPIRFRDVAGQLCGQ